MVIFQYNLYIFGIHLGTVLYPKPCYNELCYKEVVVYVVWVLIRNASLTKVLLMSTHNIRFYREIRKILTIFLMKKASFLELNDVFKNPV